MSERSTAMSRWLRRSLAVAAGVLWAFAWSDGFFLLVVAMPGASLTLLAGARIQDQLDANRAAALALAAPRGVGDRDSLERIVVSELAASSLGETKLLDGAISLAELSIHDAWRRELAIERLERAREIAGRAPPVVLPLRIAGRRWVVCLAAAAAVVSIAAIFVTPHRALLAPLALAVLAFTLATAELRRSAGLRSLLVQEASAEPARGRVVVPDDRVIAAIRALAANRPRVTSLATRITDGAPEPGRSEALRRLGAAAPRTCRPATLGGDIAVSGVTAMVLILLMEQLS